MLLLADPIIVLFPAPGAGYDQWVAFQDYLLECNDLLDQDHQIVLSQLCEGCLWNTDRFTLDLRVLSSWIKAENFAEQELDPRTLYGFIDKLINERPKLEEQLELKIVDDLPKAILIDHDPVILIEREQVEIRPAEVLTRLEGNQELAAAFHLTGGLLVYAAAYAQPPLIDPENFRILTLSEDGSMTFDTIEIEATLIERNEERREVRLSAVINPSSLIPPKSILDHADDPQAMFEYVHRQHTPAELPPYAFAETFLPSLKDMHVLNKNKKEELEKVFKEIRDLLIAYTRRRNAGERPSPPQESSTENNHHLVVGPGQIRDGDWGAWRVRICGKDYRLHYWWHSKQQIFLFSKLLTGHGDMRIDSNAADKEKAIAHQQTGNPIHG